MNNAKNKKALLALAAAFAALLVLAGVLYSRLAGDAEVLVAEPTPTLQPPNPRTRLPPVKPPGWTRPISPSMTPTATP